MTSFENNCLKTCFIDKLKLSLIHRKTLTIYLILKTEIKMNDLKQGDTVAVKATNQEAVIAFASTTLENNFYLLTSSGFVLRDEQGQIKEFFAEDLDYTEEQKIHFQYEADLHTSIIQSENEFHYYNR